METFVYKCPSCGGKVNYNEITHKWVCEYCGNNYNALFVPKKARDLPPVDERKYKLFSHYCNKCNKKFVSKGNFSCCPYCKEKCENGNEFIAANAISLTKSLEQAKNDYRNSIKKYKNLNNDYYSDNFECQFYNCDLYNGCIKLEYNGIINKYIFVNLLIPNIEYEDYRFMYEIGNIGTKDSRVYRQKNKEEVENYLIANGEYLNSVDDKNYEVEILEECIDDFVKTYKISDRNTIKIEKSFKVEDGTFIPIYVKNVKINNNDYRQYVYGNYESSIDTIFEFPTESDSREKTKKYGFLSGLSFALMIISVMTLFGFATMISILSGIDTRVLILTSIVVLVASIISYVINNKKYNYYIRTIKLTKKEYFQQIIKNSNYVKVIKVKK